MSAMRVRPRRRFAEHARQCKARPVQVAFAAIAQQFPDQRNVRPFDRRRVDEVGHLAFERACDLSQHENRRIADPRLEVCEMALGYAGLRCKRAARHATARASHAHRFAQGAEERILAFTGLDNGFSRHRRYVQ